MASLIERPIVVDNVKLLLGPITSPLTFAALPVAERHGALIVVWGASSDTLTQQGYKMVVSVRIPASLYYRSVMDMVVALDPYARKVGIVYANEEFSIFVANGISNYSKDRGFTVVYSKGVPTNIQDFTPVLTELKAANPDVVLFSSTYIPLGQLFSKQMIDLKISAKLIAVTTAGCFSPYYDVLKNLVEGIVCPTQWEPVARWNPELAKQMGYEWFGPTSEEYMRYYNITGKGRSPGFYAALGGAALLYLVKAIETAQSLDPVKVRQAFNQISGKVMTFYGPFRIDPETGTYVGGGSYLVSQWQGGKRVVVWPPEAANAKPCYPLPTWDEKARGKTCSP